MRSNISSRGQGEQSDSREDQNTQEANQQRSQYEKEQTSFVKQNTETSETQPPDGFTDL
jgi:hypothetical protein